MIRNADNLVAVSLELKIANFKGSVPEGYKRDPITETLLSVRPSFTRLCLLIRDNA